MLPAPCSPRTGSATRRAVAAGVWVAITIAAAGIGCRAPERPERQPTVVLITIESVRRDHVSVYGADPELTPNIAALAREGIVYEDHNSVTSWTLPSHVSLFTGLYPTACRVTESTDRLGDSQQTMAEMLSAAGYQTAGVVSGPFLRPLYNLNQGFEIYDESPSAPDLSHAASSVTNDRSLAAIRRILSEERDPSRPLFLFAYLWDPHFDYVPPPPYDTRFVEPGDEPIDVKGYYFSPTVHRDIPPSQLRYVKSQYNGEIRWTDDHLGELFALLKQHGLWDDALVILTADHGEEFYEHGWKGHKNNIYAESIRVPLVVKFPDGRTGRDARLTSHVDILPTVAAVTGATPPAETHGESLIAPADPHRRVFQELSATWYVQTGEGESAAGGEAKSERVDERWVGVRQHGFHLVGVPSKNYLLLFDLGSDPGESRDVSPANGEQVAHLRGLIRDWQGQMRAHASGVADGGVVQPTAEELEQLEALGYIGN